MNPYPQNPPQGYPYAAAPYYNYNPYMTQQQRLQILEQQYPQFGQTVPPPPPMPPQPPQQSEQVMPFIEVSTAAEAWDYPASSNPADWGKKQYFIDRSGETIYVKWFDANIPQTFKETYKKTIIADEEAPVERGTSPNGIPPELAEKFSTLETGINELKEMIANASTHGSGLQIPFAEPAGDGRDHERGDGGRKVQQKSGRGNGGAGKDSGAAGLE